MTNDRVEISLTRQQFFGLLKLVHLGNWMANAIHNGSEEDPIDKELEGVEDSIYSSASAAGFSDYVEYDEKLKRHFATNELDEAAHEYIEEYDEHCFWDELFYRMSDRDFEREYSEEEIRAMEWEERFEKEEPFQEKWDTELVEYGIERLEVRER